MRCWYLGVMTTFEWHIWNWIQKILTDQGEKNVVECILLSHHIIILWRPLSSKPFIWELPERFKFVIVWSVWRQGGWFSHNLQMTVMWPQLTIFYFQNAYKSNLSIKTKSGHHQHQYLYHYQPAQEMKVKIKKLSLHWC